MYTRPREIKGHEVIQDLGPECYVRFVDVEFCDPDRIATALEYVKAGLLVL